MDKPVMEITAENYYKTKTMSVSTFKGFMECEHRGLAIFKGEHKFKQTEALLVGSYVDAWCEGTLDEFIENHPEMIASTGKTKGQLKKSFRNADIIIERIKNDPMFLEFITGEKQVILTGDIDGIPFKGKADIITDERIVDLKIMRSCDRVMGKSLVEHWGYDIQGAVYQELEFQRTGIRKPFYLAIATKEEPANLEIVHIEQHNLDKAMDYVKKNLPIIMKIINGEIKPLKCNQCEYCRETKKVTEPIDSDLLGLSEYDIKIITGEEI